MPKCRNCGRSLTRFDDDICPYCGEKHPFDESYETKDMTGFITPIKGDVELRKSKKKSVTALLCLFLGMFGAHLFYLGAKKKGIIALISSLVIVIGGFLLFYFLVPGRLILPFIPLICVYATYALYSLRYFMGDNLKDENGEYLH